MNNNLYFRQAQLLLQVLPIVNREDIFALKGGTAINFFVRDLPRLSVDIDLVYLPISSRSDALAGISSALEQITQNILRLIPGVKIQRKSSGSDTTGLIITGRDAVVKIEPNLTIRGSIYPPVNYQLCEKGVELFELSVNARSLIKDELYAGKICAALDRQHPRDLFDIKLLFEHEGLTDAARKAFIVYLISHNRPMSELLNPNLLDIAEIYNREFLGMVNQPVAIEELTSARERLVREILNGLSNDEKRFLISFKSVVPDWDLLGLQGIENLPAVQWKLLNIKKMDKKRRADALLKLDRVLSNN